MTLTRSTLPQRSPMPLIVPCTCVAPAATAASVLATATSQSLWQWMPTSHAQRLARPPSTRSAISSGSVPPLVSHRMTTLAPASCGGPQRLQRVLGVVPEAVEEVLGVVDHLAALRRWQ